MIASDRDLRAVSTHADELALLAYALQDGGAAEVTSLVQPHELQNPWFGAYLQLIGERLARSEAVDEESLLHVVMKHRGRFGDPMAFSSISDPETGRPRTSSDLADLAARIRERHLLREAGFAAASLRQVAEGTPTRLGGEALPHDPAESIARIGQHLLSLVAPCAESEESSLGQAAEEAATERLRQRAEGRPLALTTGHIALNELLAGGWRAGELIVVAGATSMGKTSFAIGAACDLAEQGKRTGIVSLEMPRAEVGDRLLARVSGADLRAIRAGHLDDDPDVAGWRGYLGDLDLPVWHPPAGATLAQIGAKAMAWKSKGLSLLVVDHLGRVKHDSASERLRYDLQVAAVAKGCKSLALSLRIPVLLLVQLNRTGTARLEDAKQRAKVKPLRGAERWWEEVPLPQLSDLKESSAIEQEADVVLFPVRASELGHPDPSAGCLLVAKQRNGPKGIVPALWQAHAASYVCDSRRGEL